MATADAFDGQPKTFERTVFSESFEGVVTAGGRVPAFGAQPRADYQLVKTNNEYKRKRKYPFPKCWC
jgi:hypothetical protein